MDAINEIQAVLRQELEASKRRDTRQLIVEEAERLITVNGVEGLQLKAIAEAINIRPPSIFKHFKNRDAIIDHIGKEFMVNFMDQFQLNPDQPFEPELRRCLFTLVEMFAIRPAWVRVFLYDFSVPHGLPFLNEIVGPLEGQFDVGLLSGLKNRLGRWLDAGVKRGVCLPVEPEWLLNIILGTLTLNLVWTNREPTAHALSREEITRLHDQLFELILTYLTVRPPATM